VGIWGWSRARYTHSSILPQIVGEGWRESAGAVTSRAESGTSSRGEFPPDLRGPVLSKRTVAKKPFTPARESDRRSISFQAGKNAGGLFPRLLELVGERQCSGGRADAAGAWRGTRHAPVRRPS
jgi:hypothetical protein